MVHKPVIPLGNGATMTEEVSHFIHHMGNQLMVLMMRMEMRAASRKERLAAAKKAKRKLAGVRRISRIKAR